MMGNAEKEKTDSQYPWVPMAKNISSLLPKDGRPYTEVEAVFCLQLDYNNKKQVSITGYSNLWGWGKERVLRLFSRLSLAIEYPESTLKKRNQLGFLSPKNQTNQQTKTSLINFIDFNKLHRSSDQNQTNQQTQLKRNIKKENKKHIKNSKARIFETWWFEKYKHGHGCDYQVDDWAKFRTQVNNLLKKNLNFVDLQYLAIEFFLDKDPFIVGTDEKTGAGHNLGMFLKRIGQNTYRRYLDPDFRENNRRHIVNEDGTPKYPQA